MAADSPKSVIADWWGYPEEVAVDLIHHRHKAEGVLGGNRNWPFLAADLAHHRHEADGVGLAGARRRESALMQKERSIRQKTPPTSCRLVNQICG